MQNCLRWLPRWLGLFITFSASLKRCATMPFSSRLGEMSNLFQHGCEWPVAPLNGSCHSDTLAWGRPSRRAAVSRRSLRSVHRGDTCYATINERPRCALDGAWHGWNQISPAGASLASVSVPVCALSFSGITFCRQSNALTGSWQLKSSLDTKMLLWFTFMPTEKVLQKFNPNGSNLSLHLFFPSFLWPCFDHALRGFRYLAFICSHQTLITIHCYF